jgi:hypothetical protein
MRADRREHDHDVYTLRLMGSRIYVINNLSLVSAVQKHYRAVSGAPLMGHAISWMTGTNKSTNDMMTRDMVSNDGFFFGIKKYAFKALAPGPALDALNIAAIHAFAKQMDMLAAESSPQVELFAWVRRQIELATTDAVYGRQNPFMARVFKVPGNKFPFDRNFSIGDIFSVSFYGPGIPNLGPKALPNFLTSRSMKAREHVVRALVEVFKAGHR